MAKRHPRIALALAVNSHTVPERTWTAWIAILRATHWPGPTYIQRQFYIRESRNRLVHEALQRENEWDYLWMWDCDQSPNKNHLRYVTEVAQERKEAIVGGLYFRREYPFEVIAYDWLPKGTRTKVSGVVSTTETHVHPGTDGELYKVEPKDTFRPILSDRLFGMLQQRGLYDVDGCGTGDLLIRKDVLKRMAEAKGGTDLVFDTPPFESADFRGGVWGEDLYFCYEAKQKYGYRIRLDTRRESMHMREEPITAENYKASHQIHIPLEQFDFKAWQDEGRITVPRRESGGKIILPT